MNLSPLSSFVNPVLSRIQNSIRIHMAINLATRVADNPTHGKEIVQFLIDEGALEVRKVHDESTGEDIVFVGKPKSEYHILREVPRWQPDAMLTENQCKVLNYLQDATYSINMKVYEFVQKHRDHWQWKMHDRTMDKIGSTMKAIQEYLVKYPDGIFKQKYATPDGRRYYALMNPLTHQGGDVPRGLTQWGKKYKVKSRAAIHKIAAITKDEYGVDMSNYKLVVSNPELVFGTEYGLKGKKPVCAYAAALALQELMETGESAFIVQQDQTCSGFQHWGMELGCHNLALLTNLLGGDKKDLYTTAAEMAQLFVSGDYAYFFDRKSGKFFVMRIGYGAAAASLARGLILDKPQDDDYRYVNEDGVYIPNSLESLAKNRFNEDNYEYFIKCGWPEAVNQSQTISKAYYNGLMRLSPKLQSALRMCKEANRAAIAQNEFMHWVLPNGDVKKNVTWKPDPEAKRVRISMRDQKDVKFQFSFMPMIRQASDSAVAPTMIHSGDGVTMGEIVIRSHEDFFEPIAPIHDSTGTTVAHFEEIGPMWIDVCTKFWLNREESMFFATMRRYGITIPKKVWPKGWIPIDISKAQYHLG